MILPGSCEYLCDWTNSVCYQKDNTNNLENDNNHIKTLQGICLKGTPWSGPFLTSSFQFFHCFSNSDYSCPLLLGLPTCYFLCLKYSSFFPLPLFLPGHLISLRCLLKHYFLRETSLTSRVPIMPHTITIIILIYALLLDYLMLLLDSKLSEGRDGVSFLTVKH